MVIYIGPGGGGERKVLTSVRPPFTGPEAELVNRFFREAIKPPTVVYVPIDPTTGQVPPRPRHEAPWPWKVVGDRKVFYSPNVHEAMLRYYARVEGDKLLISKVPVLVVDYSAVISADYYGQERPPDRPLEWQFSDWKQGYMLARVKAEGGTFKVKEVIPCAHESWQFGCLPRIVEKEVEVPSGWWWVKYNASLIEVPAEVITTDENVFRFYYRAPEGMDTASILKRLPMPFVGTGLSPVEIIRLYLFRSGIVKQAKEVLAMFGWQVVGEVEVEGRPDGYVVVVRARRVSSLAPPVVWGIVIGMVVLGIMFAVREFLLYKIEAEKTRRAIEVAKATKDLGNRYQECVERCKGLQGEVQVKCIEGCGRIYSKAINAVSGATEDEKSTVGELTDLIKWAVIGVVAVNVVSALGPALRKAGGERE